MVSASDVKKIFLLISLIFLQYFSKAQVNLNNGLVAWLPFNSSMADASGNGNNGIPQGTSFTTDRFGNSNSAVMMNGLADFITVRDQMGQFSSTPFSYALWFQTNNSALQVLIGKRNYGPTNGQQYYLSLEPMIGLSSMITSNALPCPGDLSPAVMNFTTYPKPFCLDQWHVVIITFDGSMHRMYFDGQLVDQRPTNFPEMQKCNSDMRLGNWWSGDPLYFKGKMDDFRWYNRVLNNSEIDAIANDKGPGSLVDFSFNKSGCNQNIVKLKNISVNQINPVWRFSDGTVLQGNNIVDKSFSSPSRYNITLSVGQGACQDSITKPIDLNQVKDDIILTADTSVCVNDTVRLRTIDLLESCWNPTVSNGYVVPTSATTYRLDGLRKSVNLVKTDSSAPPSTSWCEDILVQAGTTYHISFSAASFSSQNAAIPSLFINGLKAGEILFAPNEAGTWKNLNLYWSSGNSGTVNFCIRSEATGPGGNNFGLNDIRIEKADFVFDTVRINFSSISFLNTSPDTAICSGKAVMIAASGGNTYTWYPSEGLSDPNVANPIASPSVTTTYKVRSTIRGCSAQDSVIVKVNAMPSLQLSSDRNVCIGGSTQISASGAMNYLWSPAEGLDDVRSPEPTATPSRSINYKVVGMSLSGCSDSGFVKVNIVPQTELYIPNAFTPNGDGKNDCFKIPGADGSKIFELSIFNRFGERIFQTTDPLKCWDGAYKGYPQPNGSYAYYLKLENGCGYQFKKGTISLLK